MTVSSSTLSAISKIDQHSAIDRFRLNLLIAVSQQSPEISAATYELLLRLINKASECTKKQMEESN